MAQSSQPSFSVQRFRSHRRAQSEDTASRMSTGFRATSDSRSKLHSRIDLAPSIAENTMARSSSMMSSSRRKAAPAPVMVRKHEQKARERSSSPLAGLRSAALGLHHLSSSSSGSLISKSSNSNATDAATASTNSSTSSNLTSSRGPLTAPSVSGPGTNVIATKQPTKPNGRSGLIHKDQDASSFVDSPVMPTPERKRPPKELMQAYSEGFYGLAGSLSDSALISSDEEEDYADDEEEEAQDKLADMHSTRDTDPEDIGQDVRDLIKATNKAFFAVDTGLDEPLGSASLRQSHEARRSQESRMSTSPRKPLPSESRSRHTYSPSNHSESPRSGPDRSTTPIPASASTSAPAPVPEKPNLTSHWSESSTDSKHSSIGISHGATAPLSPIPRGPQFIKATKKKRRSPSGSNTSKFGRGGTGRGTRWALSEGVHDILTGQRFKKPEVEELLTPERIAQLKKSNSGQKDSSGDDKQPESRPQSSQSQRDQREPLTKPAKDGISTSQPMTGALRPPRGSGVPVKASAAAESDKQERSSEESIPAKKEKMKDVTEKQSPESAGEEKQGKQSSEPSADAVVTTHELPASAMHESPPTSDADKSPSLHAVASNGKSVSSKSSFESEDNDALRNSEDGSASSASSPPPTPPAKHPARTSLSAKLNAPLPDLPTEAGDDEDSKIPDEDDENIYLKSTPYTFTKPTFKHGPITFSKAELGRAALTADDTMDWTAFQMAILGGAGELAPEDLDDEDEEFCEELSKWFDEFEMGPGMLIKDDTPSTPGSLRSSLSSRSGSIASEENLPIPCDTERDVQDRDLGYNEVKFFRRSVFKKWDGGGASHGGHHHRSASLDGTHRRGLRATTADAHRRGTAIDHFKNAGNNWGLNMSLSASKMDPIVVGEGDDDDEAESGGAKMGFNLNSDLGDYLKWEQMHLNGGGF